MSHDDTQHDHDEAQLHGLLAEFKSPADLVRACEKVRDAGFQSWDAHSPFPVHGIDNAIGIKSTRLPWISLVAGLTGLAGALLMEWWMNAHDYPWIVSGKPFFSLPANVPVIFEGTVLFAGIATFLGALVLNLLPEYFHPLFKVEKFRRVTDDGFFISIDAKDPNFNEGKTSALLKTAGALSIERCMGEPRRAYAIPRGLTYAGVVVVLLTLLPLAIFAKARVSTTKTTRVHLIDDMDAQPKYKAQSKSPLFADQRAQRPYVAGTAAIEDRRDNESFYTGKNGDVWLGDFPPEVALNEATMNRGQERFGIYCAPCHGLAGSGDGMVARRADALKEGTWVPPTQLYSAAVKSQPLGQLFNSISNGIRNMPGYAAQVSEADRWAILMYVRALQKSQTGSFSDVPAENQTQLR